MYTQSTQVTTDSSSGSAGNGQGNWEVAVAHLIVQGEEKGKQCQKGAARMRGKENLTILSIGMTGKKELLKISSDLQKYPNQKQQGAGGRWWGKIGM